MPARRHSLLRLPSLPGLIVLTVYSAIYGGRDKLLAPLFRAKGIRVVCFTDDSSNKAPGVATVVEDPPCGCPARSARWHKTHPPEGDSLWVDGVFQLVADPRPVLDAVGGAVALTPHPKKRCAYQEAIQCAARGKDKSQLVLRQTLRYMVDGFPCCSPMWQGGVIFRRAGCQRDWQDLWWAEIEAGSYRDQVSLSYVAWKAGIVVSPLPWLVPDVVTQHEHTGAPKWQPKWRTKP